MHEIVTEIQIDAPPERVWRHLVDFPRHPEWNPFIQAISGQLEVGAKLRVAVQSPHGGGMTFKPRLLKVDPARELRWLGRLLLPGLFDGEHFFTLQPVGVNTTRFVHGERFSGLLVPMLRSSLDKGTAEGFNAMNRALKARVEA